MTTTVESRHLAATYWKNNSELIKACADLRYLKPTDKIIDPTYGMGNWWNAWQPEVPIVKHDLRLDGVDFTNLPHEADEFDACTFDPPYVAKGGRATSGIAEMDDRFGLGDAPKTPELLQELIQLGMREIDRVVKPRGFVLVKVMDYVSSGTLWPGVMYTWDYATRVLQWDLVDRSIHLRKANALQPKRSRGDGQPVRQHHFGANYSTLLVFSTGKVRRCDS